MSSPAAHAADAIELRPFSSGDMQILLFVLVSAVISILFGGWLMMSVMKRDPGTPAMQEVARSIQEGALAYLRRQVMTMLGLVVALSIALYFIYNMVYPTQPALSIGIALAFLLGVGASYLAGYAGMWMAVNGNVRTAAAALTSFKGALETAFQAGAVSGMFTVGLGLLGATLIFLLYREDAMKVLVGFGFGGSLAALFMRVGGGIFTKAADVGADLVGKVEAGIPEDDPRNPATIADNVGDNVGDCAGMAADVFESYEVTLVAAIILGAAAGAVVGAAAMMKLVMYALMVRAVGVFASIIGVLSVRGQEREDMDPMQPINVGFWISALAATIGFGAVSYVYMRDIPLIRDGVAGPGFPWYSYFGATLMGIILALVIGRLTEYFTSTEFAPVKEIARSSRTGPATMILSGFSSGLESSVWGILAIGATLLGSVIIFHGSLELAAYGVALAGLGLLTTTGFILAMDTFGPISDNANGIFEMSGALHEEEARGESRAGMIVARLDAVGNTTKALTKGFAIATAVIAAVALFRSFMEDAQLTEAAARATGGIVPGEPAITGIRIDIPEVFIGVLIGAAVPFLFCSFAINAVSRAATLLVEEVRRQFRENPGIMAGTVKPDYARCVALCTAAAQKELLGPGILATFSPILVAFALGYGHPKIGAMALGGFLAGAIVVGQQMEVLLSNSGGAWDNGKKLIEEGLYGGKGSEAHKAGVICDTVGDPFKDTAGPALNPLIKVMNLVGILIAPIAIAPISPAVRWSIVAVSAALLGAAIMFSKRAPQELLVSAAEIVDEVREDLPTPPSPGGAIKR
ncbi:MAG: sodium-translocating pyrophosphatase [Armatimonadetes bacterium]|nr:sodium-translocating pyrophosphatase [Armatimonadota bacterium]